MQVNPLIWLLMDDRAGNRSQCLGVAEALGFPYEIRDIEYNALGRLPNGVIGASFIALSPKTRAALVAPWPDLVIAAGRRTAGVARTIKRQNSGRTRIVQIMFPGRSGLSEFDLIAAPGHDRIGPLPNVVTITGAPHSLTPEKLQSARTEWQPAFGELPTPLISVFLGGDTSRKSFDSTLAADFGVAVNNMALDCDGGLLISTSRRTSPAAANSFLAGISVPHLVYKWGDEAENPYVGYLACADILIVSGDSVSMISEACAGTRPVYIFAPQGFVVDKHARLHDDLYKGGFARPFNGKHEEWFHSPLNAAGDIAAAIRNLLEDTTAD